MNRLIFFILLLFTFFGCSDDKKQEKVLLDSIIKVHDKVMGADDRLMKNKMKLDTLLKSKLDPKTDTAAERNMMMGLSVKLTNAEDAMESWMQKFDPDQKGKSHQEIMSYYRDQKLQVTGIDAEMNDAIKLSDKYLAHIKQ